MEEIGELTQYEQMLIGTNCRAIAFLENMVTEEYVRNKLPSISKSYPFINWKIEGNKIFSGLPPKITCSELDECEETEFVTNCLSTFFTQEMNEIFIIKMKNTNKGAVLFASNHCFCDDPLVGHFVSDLVSSKTEFDVVERIPAEKLVENIEELHQTLKLKDPFTVPPLKEPREGRIFYRGIARSFDIQAILKVCKSIHIKPQAFLSACDIYSVKTVFDLKPDFNILNQVSINIRRALGISPISPMIKISIVYLESHITKESTMKDLMINLQQQIDELVPKYQLPHYRLTTYNKFQVQMPAGMVSNIGIIESENADIWVHGGQYQFPDVLRTIQSFTSHACTTRGKLNIVFTMLHPGCSDDFVQKYTSTFIDLLANPEKVLSLKLF